MTGFKKKKKKTRGHEKLSGFILQDRRVFNNIFNHTLILVNKESEKFT